jgi:hypothetical protein
LLSSLLLFLGWFQRGFFYLHYHIELEYKENTSYESSFESIIGKSIAETEDEIREAIKFRWLKSNSVHGGKIKDSSTGMGVF